MAKQKANPTPARESEPNLVQLATRVPKPLLRSVKLYCVDSDTSVMAFVTQALEDRLTLVKQPRAAKRRSAAA